jgi:hypothetical protein
MSDPNIDAIIDDDGLRPNMFGSEVFTSAPAVEPTYAFAMPPPTSSGYIDDGQIISPAIPKVSFLQRTNYVPESAEPRMMLFSIPEPNIAPPDDTAGLRDPTVFYNGDTRIFELAGGGGGGGGTLAETLANGNSAGAYNIDMNGNNIENVNTIYSSTGNDIAIAGDANISMTTINGEIGLVGKDILIKKTNALAMAARMLAASGEFEGITPFDAPPATFLDSYLDIESEDNIKINSTGVVDVYGTSMNVYTDIDMSANKITHLAAPTVNDDAATKLYVDTAAGGGASNWSAYPALFPVDISGKDINNVELITGLPAISNPIVINNSYNLGGELNKHAVIIAGGFDTVGLESKPVSVAIKKEAFYTGAGDEELTSLNFVGLDDAGDEEEYAAIDTIVNDNTKASTNASMKLGVNVNSVRTTMLTLDGSNNLVKMGAVLDISGYNINNAININGVGSTGVMTLNNKMTIDASNNLIKMGTAVDMSGNNINNAATINGVGSTGRITMPNGLLDLSGNTATLTLGQNPIYNRVTATGSFPAGLSINDPFTAGDANQTAYHLATIGTTQTSVLTTMCRKGQFTNMFGTQGTSANNTFVIGSQTGNCDFEIRKNVGIAPANLTGGNLLAQFNRTGAVSLPLLGTATTSNTLYFNTANGLVTYGAAPAGGNTWSTYPATSAVDMSGFAINKVSGLSNATGTLNIGADDLNLSCTGLTSVLNINSALGTAIVAGGAVDITAGGTTAINSTGNVTIGSLGTTSIENFNLNNSVLTKVAATADLQLNNIATITNSAGNIDISATNVNIENYSMNGSVLTKLTGAADLQLNNISKITNNSAVIDISSSSVNLNKFQFASSTLSAPGTTRLFLDDVEAINNDAVAGRIDITADIIRANAFEFSGSSLNTNAADFTLNNIGKLNESTGGSLIDSYATINAVGTGLTDAVGFKATTLTASVGTAAGFYSDATEASASGSIAAGFAAVGTTANNINGAAIGLQVQTVLGGATSGTATGVEVTGAMTGATKRGFWEHSPSAGVQNTFMNRVGVGADANSNYMLDVSGLTRIYTTAANPTSLLLENQEAGAAANILQIYKNSASPAVNDIVGNIQFAANTTTGVKHTYASIQGAIQDPTNASEDGEMRLRATNNGTVKDFLHVDGINSLVAINPSAASVAFSVEDNSGNNIVYADPVNQNVMFKNYPQRYIYDICGNYTLTLPNGFNTIRILAFGAGGGGGSGRKGTSSCFGGGAGAGGNGVELWYDRRELYPDSTGSITLYITPGQGGAGGAAVSTAATNGNNGGNGGTTYVNLDAFGAGASQRLIPDQATGGGLGGSGGTNAAGTGGNASNFASDRNIGSPGRAGASSSITAQPVRNTAALLYNGSVYSQTGGSGAGGGIDAAGTTQYAGGIFVSPCGQKYNALGANVNKGGAAGTAGGTAGGAGGIVSFDNLSTAAVRPLAGMCSIMGGGGASIGGNGGAGGGWTAGVAGSRGDGGGGGGATGNAGVVPSGAGGRGADGFVYITVW